MEATRHSTESNGLSSRPKVHFDIEIYRTYCMPKNEYNSDSFKAEYSDVCYIIVFNSLTIYY